MTDAPRHPDIQIMTAFIDGKLAPDQIGQVAAHVRGCGECRTIVTETARLEREEVRATRRHGTPWRWLAAAALLAVVVAVPAWRLTRRRDPIERLIAAAHQEHRSIEPRLVGFRWARLQAPSRGGSIADPAEMKLIGAAGEVIEQTAGANAPEQIHARGLALLLSGRRTEGIAALERAARNSKEARLWNDLAAARYAASEEHAAELPLALGDVDRALRLDPTLREARFNRALIVERLGLREQARDAWQRYLEIDPGGEWSAEARAHLRALDKQGRRFEPRFLETMTPAALVQEFPQEARRHVEGLLLARWASAGDAASLAKARAIGAALAGAKAEQMAADAVAAIDTAGASQRATLVSAHALYGEGGADYSRRRYGLAEKKFLRAAELFRRGGSPMAEAARFFAATSAFNQHRGAEARDALSRLLTGIDRKRHRALAAEIQRQIAVVANADGDYGLGARSADKAAAGFRDLGERFNAAFADGVAAHALDMMGASDLAWSRRQRAYLELAANPKVLAAALHSAAMTLAAFGHDQSAAALIDMLIEQERDEPAQLATALASRARLAARGGEAASGLQTIAQARAAANRVADAALRETLGAELDLAEASVRRTIEPRAAVAALDRSIPFFGSERLNYLLPEAYLQRARAFRATGDDAAAAADYAAGLREIEQQRRAIDDGELRLRFLDIGAQIVDDSVELHLSRGDVAAAFAVADHAHAQNDAPAAPTPINRGIAVIEYVALPRSLAIFCVTSEGIEVKRVDVDRATLSARVASYVEKIRLRAPANQIDADGAELYQLLVAPLQARIASSAEVVIVPDRELHAVPFAALYDARRRRYLIEETTIRLAPAAAAARAQNPLALTPALVVADPLTARWPQLRASRAEAAAIAASYGVIMLAGADATRARFIEAAKASALIHFSGHADSDEADSYGSLLFSPDGDDSGVLGAGEIGRLALGRRPLVVLAACGTFRGSRRHVAGMSSLARAFLLAGARGVIGTLWEIEDDLSAGLFLDIHEQLRAGVSPARAVRHAQLAMIHASDARLRHPATWAPVELLGN